MFVKGFQKPKRLEVERRTLSAKFGRFHAQPFERGYGTTIGSALRRILLSSVEGSAVTAVRIDGEGQLTRDQASCSFEQTSG